ncbi:hypothetical protein ACQ5SP_11835 [Rhodovulum sp. YNF3179]|uniref:hypothetical protein n=1 Tax=Rhodovulum sp. YNF3179 TaxID=3425127 RepID=UPI003D349A6B
MPLYRKIERAALILSAFFSGFFLGALEFEAALAALALRPAVSLVISVADTFCAAFTGRHIVVVPPSYWQGET